MSKQDAEDVDASTAAQLEKFLKHVIDDMFEGLQIISHDWRYLYVNKTVARQGKKEKEELIGFTMMECYPGIEETPMFKNLEKAKREQVSMQMKNEFTYPDGTKGWFNLYIHPIVEGILILSIDISEQKFLQKELKKKIEELDRLGNALVSREERMVALKNEIKKLKAVTDQNDF
jgi:two-component system, sensor histidine kinase PdtaS